MQASYGFIETRGFVAAVTAADAMVKAADVELLKFRKVGGALVTIIVKGDLASCQAAVEAGAKAAQETGLLVSSHIIANPYEDTETQVESKPRGRGRGMGKAQRKRPVARPKPKPAATESPVEKILNYLKGKKQGATLKDLAGLLKKSPTEVRVLIKQLMDQGKIEKIQQKYFFNA